MSFKGRCRKIAAEALGQGCKVQKIKGNIVVLRTEPNGRERDWQRRVKRVVEETLPNWELDKAGKGLTVFGCLSK